jgi:hypothetical protein
MNAERPATAHPLKTVLSFTGSMLLIPSAMLLLYLVLYVLVPWLADVTNLHPAGWGDLMTPFVG